MSERKNNGCVIAVCACGGWVMAAVLDGTKHDGDHFREAGKLAAMGFTVRSPVSVEDVRAMPMCHYRGDCTTNPKKVAEAKERERSQQVEAPL